MADAVTDMSPGPTDVAGLSKSRQAKSDVTELELDLLLEGIYRVKGYDFRGYSRSSLRRRLFQRVAAEGLRSLSGLQERALHDSTCMDNVVRDLSVNVTSMFRSPAFYSAFRNRIVPRLRTYPFLRIWDAGCATGEEAFSLAIVLQEEGLYERSRIYATDINHFALERAEAGVVPIERMREYTENYIESGGERAFVEYYVANAKTARIRRSVLRNIIFAQHNLATDGCFNEFNVVICRNVMIYFDRPLQDRVHGILLGSLGRLGVLALGERESVRFTQVERCYEEIDHPARLYRKVA
jgi:chemotaxis protein methyltransferase CheR